VEVRRATADDCDGVIACARAYDLHVCDDDHVAYLFHLAHANDGMFVALDADRVVGFLCAIVMPHPFSGEINVNVVAIFVHPTHRGSTAAFRLLRLLWRWVLRIPVDTVTLSGPKGSGLSRILERLAFVCVETVYVLRLRHGVCPVAGWRPDRMGGQ
jgi:GNAT superfamily N-acetyltransferase